jgi:hypothetical protein
MNEQHTRITIEKWIRHALGTSQELIDSVHVPFSMVSIPGSQRTLPELLQHLAGIPREEVLLLQGRDRATIIDQLGGPLNDRQEFADAVAASLMVFEDVWQGLNLEAMYRNAVGHELTGYDWGVEALSHAMHHRSQLFIALRVHGIDISSSLLDRFFSGHLPTSRT